MNRLSYDPYDSSITDVVFNEVTNGYVDPANETETRKQLSTPFKQVKDFINSEIMPLSITVTSSSFNSLPQTISNTKITSDHVVVNAVLSNPSAQTGDWTVTTSNGSLTISGTINGTTTITLNLIKSE